MPTDTEKTILIIDDEADVLFVLKTALERRGFKIAEACNGLEALDKVNTVKPDAIVLDLMMPKMDGHSVTIRLKENPATTSIPVIVMTGKGELKELLTIREDVKVVAYFEKPFKVSTLVEKLQEIL